MLAVLWIGLVFLGLLGLSAAFGILIGKCIALGEDTGPERHVPHAAPFRRQS